MKYERIDYESNHSEVNLRTHHQSIKEPIRYKAPQPAPNTARETKVSPRSYFYPTPDHSNHLNIKPKESIVKPINLSNIPRHVNVCSSNRTANYPYSHNNLSHRNQSKDKKKDRKNFTCL
jgi:hypothetical protein